MDGASEEDGGTLRSDDDRLPVQAVTQTDKDAVLVAYDDRVKVSHHRPELDPLLFWYGPTTPPLSLQYSVEICRMGQTILNLKE